MSAYVSHVQRCTDVNCDAVVLTHLAYSPMKRCPFCKAPMRFETPKAVADEAPPDTFWHRVFKRLGLVK